MAEEIKPCKLCGGTNVQLGSSKQGLLTHHWVRCYGKTEDGKYCSACGKTKMSAAAAIQSWNKGELE